MAAEQAPELSMSVPDPHITLPEGRFEGRQAFGERIRQALQSAAQQGWNLLLLSDADFVDWPLGERSVIDALNAWAGRGRQMQLLARDFAPLRSAHPRFVQWRTTWSHLVQARHWPVAPASDLPSAFWSQAWTMERLDPSRCIGVCSVDAGRRTALRERLDNAWHQASPGFPADTLGL